MKKQKITFSLFFALSIGVINLIDFLVGGALFTIFALSTERIFAGMEFWRLVSYPLFSGSIEGFFLFGAIFIFISPKLENFLSTKIYPLFLFLIALVLGAITTIIFNSKSIIIGGMEGISFFLFTVFMMLLVKDNYLREKQPALAIGVCTVIFWGLFKYFIAKTHGIEAVLPSVVISATGVIIGLLVYCQIYFLIKTRIKNAKTRMQPMKQIYIPTNEELSYAMFNNPNIREMLVNAKFSNPNFLVKNSTVKEVEYYDEEERLNFILDKMNESGKESITPEEQFFLENYSKKMM